MNHLLKCLRLFLYHVEHKSFFLALCRYNGEGIPSFQENKQSMLEDLERNEWPITMDDIAKYEDEIKQAELYLFQSKELQETSEKVLFPFIFWYLRKRFKHQNHLKDICRYAFETKRGCKIPSLVACKQWDQKGSRPGTLPTDQKGSRPGTLPTFLAISL